MTRRLLILICTAILALAGAGCGDDSSDLPAPPEITAAPDDRDGGDDRDDRDGGDDRDDRDG